MLYGETSYPSVRVVTFEGDLGSDDDTELRKLFVWLQDEGPTNVVWNLGKVEFLDSTALGTIVWGMKNLREVGGDLRLCCLTGFVDRLFKLTSLDMAFKIFQTEDEAVHSYD